MAGPEPQQVCALQQQAGSIGSDAHRPDTASPQPRHSFIGLRCLCSPTYILMVGRGCGKFHGTPAPCSISQDFIAGKISSLAARTSIHAMPALTLHGRWSGTIGRTIVASSMTGPRSAKALSLFSGPAVAYRLPKRQTAPWKAWKANGASVIGDHHGQEKGPQSGGHECVR